MFWNRKMQINLNNKKYNVNNDITLKNLLIKLKMPEKTVVATVNDEIIEQSDFDKIHLKNNDDVELFSFVGGG